MLIDVNETANDIKKNQWAKNNNGAYTVMFMWAICLPYKITKIQMLHNLFEGTIMCYPLQRNILEKKER